MSEASESVSLWTTMRRGAGIVALLALLVFVALNFGRVDVDFLIADVRLPLAFALILAAALGFLVGMASTRRPRI